MAALDRPVALEVRFVDSDARGGSVPLAEKDHELVSEAVPGVRDQGSYEVTVARINSTADPMRPVLVESLRSASAVIVAEEPA